FAARRCAAKCSCRGGRDVTSYATPRFGGQYPKDWCRGVDVVPAEQVFIGLTTSGLCAVGIAQEEWFLRETRKGRRLVELCGTRNAVWVLRGLLALGVAFGLAL